MTRPAVVLGVGAAAAACAVLVATLAASPNGTASAGAAPEPEIPNAPRHVHPRIPGASLAVRGEPDGTILGVEGIAQAPVGARVALLELAERLGVPVDSLAVVVAAESGWRADAINAVPAAGLIQLTTGAHLPPWLTSDAIRAIVRMSAEEQIRQIAAAYYARFSPAQIRGAHAGALFLANLLPSFLGRPESAVLADANDPETASRYRANKGLDRAGKGRILVADAYDYAASVARAGARRSRVRAVAPGEVVPELARGDFRAVPELATECRTTEAPHTAALRAHVLGRYGGRDLGILRACALGGASEHHEGRAWDWAPPSAAAASAALQELLGDPRRAIMLAIYERKIWRAYPWHGAQPGTWGPYQGASEHRDHVHFSQWKTTRQT